MMATQWEYKVIHMGYEHAVSPVAEEKLNAVGSDGWEAVAAWGDDLGHECSVILKRQKSK